jgi:hypothetical protein
MRTECVSIPADTFGVAARSGPTYVGVFVHITGSLICTTAAAPTFVRPGHCCNPNVLVLLLIHSVLLLGPDLLM